MVRPFRIGVFCVPGFALMSYASTVEPFRAANLLSGQELYQVIQYNVKDHPVPSSGPASVTSQRLIDEGELPDYLFVVAGGDPNRYDDPAVFGWLRRLARMGVTLGGVSGGPVILARAGVMARRRMTVHWEHAGGLEEMDSDLMLERSLYVVDRDRMTCAGGIAALDMVHTLISHHHGGQFARLVSDWFLHTEIRPSVGPQRSALQARVGTSNANVLEAIRAMEANLSNPLKLDDLARIVGVSPRQLGRLFHVHVGEPAMGYYMQLRLEHAASLLRNSSLSITEISLATGFSSLSHFSRQFSQRFELSARELRKSRE